MYISQLMNKASTGALELAQAIHYDMDQARAMLDVMKVRMDAHRHLYTSTDRNQINYILGLLDKVMLTIEKVDN